MNVGELFLGRSFAERPHKDGTAIIQVASLFNQLLQQFPRAEFAALVKKNNAERCAKGFGCWTQLVSMLFCQLADADSLREICNGLGCCLGKLVHLGIGKAPNKSTLSYANEHRPAQLYEEVFYAGLNRCRDQEGLGQRKQKFRLKNKLLSLDSTAHTLLRLICRMLRYGQEYVEQGMRAYEDNYRQQRIKWLEKEARTLNLTLAPASPGL